MTKEELKEFSVFRRELIQKQKMLVDLRDNISIASPKFDNEIKGQGPVKSMICEQIVRVVDLENEIAKSIETTYNRLIEIEDAINTLEGEERIIMRERYIFGKKWETIASEQVYDWRNVHKIHSRALQKLKK